MKKIFFSFLFLVFAAFGFCAQTEPFLSAASQKGQASLLSVFPHSSLSVRDREIVEKALALLNAFPPSGKKALKDLTAEDFPSVRISMYIAPSKYLEKFLGREKNSFCKESLGKTLCVFHDGGERKEFRVLISSDILGKGENDAQQENGAALAGLSAVLAREIYGHVYWTLYEQGQNRSEKEREMYAYEQVKEFLDRVLASDLCRSEGPAFYGCLRSEQEEAVYAWYVWSRR